MQNPSPKSPGSLLQIPLLLSIKQPSTRQAGECSQTQGTPSDRDRQEMSGTKTCSAEGGAGIQTQGCSRTAAYANPLRTENLLPLIFTSRLLLPSPASLGRWRFGMSKSLKSNPFLSADVGEPKPVLCFQALC